MSLPKPYRVPLKTEREKFDNDGQTRSGKFFTIVYLPPPNAEKKPRFAVLVSRKVSNLAVVRNKLKRRTLNIVIDLLSSIPSGDYLIIPKPVAINADFPKLTSDLKNTLLS